MGFIFTTTGYAKIRVRGNIENLLDYQTVANGQHPTMATSCYRNTFNGCTNLTTVPSLPATTLTEGCYHHMFAGCTDITTAPSLPATTLANSCYSNMFYNCISLTTAPELPATTLADFCYAFMFRNCLSLTTAPSLPATTLANSCYQCMFMECSNLTSISELPATTLANSCYGAMFTACTKIKLSTTQTGEYTQVYRIPTSGTGTTASNALLNMFNNTGGTFTGTPSINTTYYLSNTNTIVPASGQSSGYNVNFYLTTNAMGGSGQTVYLKTNSAPTSASDYTYVVQLATSSTPTQNTLPSSPISVNSLYIWTNADFSQLTFAPMYGFKNSALATSDYSGSNPARQIPKGYTNAENINFSSTIVNSYDGYISIRMAYED